jgi:peptidoglycan/xylan/chitin deacetylase (PgdA/CDA1 family)
MSLRRFLATLTLAIPLMSNSSGAQTRTVAFTVDDLPFAQAGGNLPMPPADVKTAASVNDKLLAALARHHIPVTGFVIEKHTENLGIETGTQILREWTERGFDLGNHTYSHPDFDNLTAAQMEEEIARGETTFVPLMKAATRKPEFFRFPYNHTGDTKEKHDAVAAFLVQHGYWLAPCTIDNSDWLFNETYVVMLARHDNAAAAKLRADYLVYTSAEIDYYSALNKQVLGYEPPHIMLIHDNQLNADVIEDLLSIFEKKLYRFVTLSQAEADPAYRTPETFITKDGPMWGYRWAQVRNVRVDGRLEPDPPAWITAYVKESAKP